MPSQIGARQGGFGGFADFALLTILYSRIQYAVEPAHLGFLLPGSEICIVTNLLRLPKNST